MHAVITAFAAMMPLVVVAMVVFAITKDALIGTIASIITFGITVGAADWYLTDGGGFGIIVWYGIVVIFTVFIVLPCAAIASDSTTKR
jgi:hypothetical protein